MNYRPITDLWILGRPKVKYYGAYPAGFLERARPIMGVGIDETLWHLPGGMARKYNESRIGPHATLSGFGGNDKTFDLAEDCEPDYVVDLCEMDEWIGDNDGDYVHIKTQKPTNLRGRKHLCLPKPKGILIDLPYTENDAQHYSPGPEKLPKLNSVFQNCLRVAGISTAIAVLDYKWPSPGKYKPDWICYACIAVTTGINQNMRTFTAWRRRYE